MEGLDHAMFSRALGSVQPAVVGWKRLDWVTDERIERECVEAEERARVLVKDSDDSVFWFSDYGADWIKQTGGYNYLTHGDLRMLTASYE